MNLKEWPIGYKLLAVCSICMGVATGLILLIEYLA